MTKEKRVEMVINNTVVVFFFFQKTNEQDNIGKPSKWLEV